MNLVVLNEGTSTTFPRFSYGETTVDITMASEDIVPQVEGWHASEGYTATNHQYVRYCIAAIEPQELAKSLDVPNWNLDKLDAEKFRPTICEKLQPNLLPMA